MISLKKDSQRIIDRIRAGFFISAAIIERVLFIQKFLNLFYIRGGGEYGRDVGQDL